MYVVLLKLSLPLSFPKKLNCIQCDTVFKLLYPFKGLMVLPLIYLKHATVNRH